MKGGGEDGRSVCGGGMEASSGRKQAEFLNMGMMANLARNGLSMLAGGHGSESAGGAPFSLTRLPNLERPCPALGLRFKEEGAAGSIEEKLDRLTNNYECWRLILKLGTQWPTWNGVAAPSQAATGHELGVMKEEKPPGRPLHQPQDILELIATRALEALAQTPSDHYGKTGAGGMLARKQTIKEVMDSKPAAETLPAVTGPAAKSPSLFPEVLVSKTTSTRPRTAAAPTIFYDGIVNDCDNIPADEYHPGTGGYQTSINREVHVVNHYYGSLIWQVPVTIWSGARPIMMFAEKAGVSLNPRALFRNVKCVAPPRQQRDHDQLQHRTTSSSQLEEASPSGHANRLLPALRDEGSDLSASSDDLEPAGECSNSDSPAPVLPFKFTMLTTSEANSCHHVTSKPLPNARKNSLARFLDSRKRGTASCSKVRSPKKQALGDHGCWPSESNNYQDFNVSGKSPMDVGTHAILHKASGRAPTSDAEMKSHLLSEINRIPLK